jgi:hypothetical protein
MSVEHKWAIFRRSRRSGLPLWLEISLILLIKVALLLLLWKLFFSHPPTKHMALPVPVVEQHLLSQAADTRPDLPATGPSPDPAAATKEISTLPPEALYGSH